jgi:integrase
MAFCALRTIEVERADLGDLTTVDSLPTLRIQGKGSSEKDDIAVIYHSKAQEALYDYLAARGNKPGPLFVSLSRRSYGGRMTTRAIRDLKKYFTAAGIVDPRKTLHSLRHSAISKVAKANIMKARQVARHASIDTTMIYVHENDRLTDPGEQFIDYVNGNGK